MSNLGNVLRQSLSLIHNDHKRRKISGEKKDLFPVIKIRAEQVVDAQ